MVTNSNKTVIYTGVTNDLKRKINEHKNRKGSSFTKRYNINMLVYYESFSSIYDEIVVEKKNKAGSRAKKIALIQSPNPLKSKKGCKHNTHSPAFDFRFLH